MQHNKDYAKRIKQPDFNIGDILTWSSRGAYNKTTKTGTVIAIIEPGEEPLQAKVEFYKYEAIHGWGSARVTRSYLIAVERKSKRGCKPKLYFPFSNLLTKENL